MKQPTPLADKAQAIRGQVWYKEFAKLKATGMTSSQLQAVYALLDRKHLFGTATNAAAAERALALVVEETR